MRIYYDKDTKHLCDRYPYNIEQTADSPFIEVVEDEAQKTYTAPWGYYWGVIHEKLELLEDTEITSSSQYLIEKYNNEITDLKDYLTETDFTVSKINEAVAIGDDEEVANLKTKYADDLVKRKEARVKINELEALIASLEE